ncbi:hypothetical protein BCR39DRAFT_561639 [Naematelia encephala]|uniref:Uncharacterized protein n=1 Tax=Naematelia encephala TaxID=71784 RepID=A0A1Y2ANU5_9TREE|nr:hypothetical protein BCR39DRAFT_561639 [Naematelia encephala]
MATKVELAAAERIGPNAIEWVKNIRSDPVWGSKAARAAFEATFGGPIQEWTCSADRYFPPAAEKLGLWRISQVTPDVITIPKTAHRGVHCEGSGLKDHVSNCHPAFIYEHPSIANGLFKKCLKMSSIHGIPAVIRVVKRKSGDSNAFPTVTPRKKAKRDLAAAESGSSAVIVSSRTQVSSSTPSKRQKRTSPPRKFDKAGKQKVSNIRTRLPPSSPLVPRPRQPQVINITSEGMESEEEEGEGVHSRIRDSQVDELDSEIEVPQTTSGDFEFEFEKESPPGGFGTSKPKPRGDSSRPTQPNVDSATDSAPKSTATLLDASNRLGQNETGQPKSPNQSGSLPQKVAKKPRERQPQQPYRPAAVHAESQPYPQINISGMGFHYIPRDEALTHPRFRPIDPIFKPPSHPLIPLNLPSHQSGSSDFFNDSAAIRSIRDRIVISLNQVPPEYNEIAARLVEVGSQMSQLGAWHSENNTRVAMAVGAFKNELEESRTAVGVLQDSIETKEETLRQMDREVSTLLGQIEAKNVEISALQSQLSNSTVDVQTELTTLKNRISTTEERFRAAIQDRDKALNDRDMAIVASDQLKKERDDSIRKEQEAIRARDNAIRAAQVARDDHARLLHDVQDVLALREQIDELIGLVALKDWAMRELEERKNAEEARYQMTSRDLIEASEKALELETELANERSLRKDLLEELKMEVEMRSAAEREAETARIDAQRLWEGAEQVRIGSLKRRPSSPLTDLPDDRAGSSSGMALRRSGRRKAHHL